MRIIITEGMFKDMYNQLFGQYQIKPKPKQQKTSNVKQTTAPTPAPTPAPTGKQKYDGSLLSVSANIWPFLREWEGDPKNRKNGIKEPKYKAYKDAVGVWTIGYGHTQNVKPTDVLKSKKEADDLLVLDVRENANYIRKILSDWKTKKIPGHMVTQGQFDALVSLSFNSGIGNLRKSQFLQELKKGNDIKAGELLKTYNTVGLSGVSKRREGELKLFQS